MNNIKIQQIKFEETKNRVDEAINKLYQKDLFLFIAGVHERTIAHKLAEYLQQEFKGVWHVDCEYNRDQLNYKLLDIIVKDQTEKDKHIYPDIIIHVRGQSAKAFNKLVVEIKTSNLDNKGDIEKLKGLTSSEYKYQYQYGLFIRFNNNVSKDTLIDNLILDRKWFENGKEIIDEGL